MAKFKKKFKKGLALEYTSGCGCMVAVLALNLIFGAMSVNYCLESFMNKHLGFWVAGLLGFFFAEITIPLAIICWVLRLFGVEAPFIH